MFKKMIEVFMHLPIVNLIPVMDSFLMELPNAWNDLPAEKKKEYMQSLLAAGAKAASEYAQKA